jgi:hypothetical protein
MAPLQVRRRFKEEFMNSAWIYPFIILGGALQTCGAAMNAQLFNSFGKRFPSR